MGTPIQPFSWHVADLDGLYVIRNIDEQILFEHSKDAERQEKIDHCNLAAASPEMFACLEEFVLLTERQQPGIKAYVTTNGDIQRARDRAVSAIAKAKGEA